MQIVISILVNAVAVFVAAYILPGVDVKDFMTAIIVAIILGVFNTFVKPLLIFFTLPLNILTLGLFTFVINGIIVVLTSKLVSGFTVDNFWWAILFSIVISLVSSFLNNLRSK